MLEEKACIFSALGILNNYTSFIPFFFLSRTPDIDGTYDISNFVHVEELVAYGFCLYT